LLRFYVHTTKSVLKPLELLDLRNADSSPPLNGEGSFYTPSIPPRLERLGFPVMICEKDVSLMLSMKF
jgi:hypothetical protein